MAASVSISLSADDIRYAQTTVLAALTGMDQTSWTGWTTRRNMPESTQKDMAEKLGMSLEEFQKGYELRKRDAAEAKAVQTKLKKILEITSLDACA